MSDPTHIGKYQLEEQLGGGMASVFLARDTVMDRPVVLKVLKEANEDARNRFLQEARVAGRLFHDNIIRAYDFGEDESGRPFLVVEYLKGQDLGKALKAGALGDLASRLKMAEAVANALEYIHSKDVVHRDVKPDNVFLTDDGKVKLMDFGIARLGNTSLTQAGFAIGTPPYMAPEQIRAEPPTPQVDVYAFGLLVFELITGRRAFSAESYEQVFYKVLNEPLDQTALREAGASPQLISLVNRCAAKTVAERPQGFAQVKDELRTLPDRGATSFTVASQAVTQLFVPTVPVVAATSTPVMAQKLGEAHKPPLLWIGLGAAVLVAMGLGAWFMKAKTPEAELNASTSAPVSLPKQPTPPDGMVLVSEGPFLFGRDKQSVTLPSYFIDKCEVSNAQYEKFCQATGRKLPSGFPKEKLDYPVVNVTFQDAKAYAQWAGKRIPTSQEWEKAARGTTGYAFPWGGAADPKFANVSTPGRPMQLVPVLQFEEGKSQYGALQMVGNVLEWVDSPGKDRPNTVMVRGGSFQDSLDKIPDVMWDAAEVPPTLAKPVIGIRCVASVR